MNKTVFVTGGAGYIGSHACKELYRCGYNPVTVDNLIYGHPWAVKWGPLEECDIADSDRLDELFKQYSPIAVIHFAASSHVAVSVADPGQYYTNNVAGTISLLETMRRNGCANFVFSSSCSTYGKPDRVPIREDHPRKPISPYGTSKLMVEEIIADYHMAYDFNYIALRYFNAAGADPDGEIGEAHDPETHLVPLTIFTALGRRKEIAVFGTDYETPDGSAVRDYTHVMDIAAAHVSSLEHLRSGKESGCINLGTGQGYSVLEIIKAVEDVSGKTLPVIYSDRRPGDPAT
ncbi:MAG: UDP-glucose 4-epimerase GalE, partial [Desulfobulbaceae bacterium]|nr:UDP-glucose 4-epimerase GalE [Desulfobulbaceae bacterium]